MSLLEIKRLCTDVYLFTDRKLGFCNNSVVIFSGEGPIILDVFRDRDQFEEIADFIKKKGYDEPRTLIYTHWHTDHVCGNRIFKNISVVAHRSTLFHLEEFINNDLDRLKERDILEKDTSIVLPTLTFNDEMLVSIGGKELKLMHCPGHTYDSIIIYDVTDNVLVAGDNLIGKEVPFFMPPSIPPDESDVNQEYLEGAFEKIEKIGAAVIVPGHGSIQEASLLINDNRKRYYQCLENKLMFLE